MKANRVLYKLLSGLDRNKIAKNTSVLLIGQIVAYGMGVIYIAALARYVGAEGIGKISIANSLNSLLILVVAPGLTTILVRDVAADHQKAAAYIVNTLVVRLFLGVPFFLLTSLVARLAGYSGDTVTIIRIYSLAYLLDSLGQILIAAFEAFERMEFEAASVIVQTMANVVLSLLAIYFQWSLMIIVIVSVIAQVIKILFMLIVCHLRLVRFKWAISWVMSKSLFVASSSFGILLIFAAAKAQTATVILSLFRSENEVGIYSAANTFLGMLLFVPMALSSAVFPTFSRLAILSKQDLQRFYEVCFKYLLVIGCPLGTITLLVGGKVLVLIFGQKFDASVPVLSILALFLFTVVGYCNGPLLKATGRQNFLVWTESLAVLANAMLCVVMVPRWGPSGAAMAFVLAGLGTFLVHSIAAHRIFRLPLPWLTMGKILVTTFFMGLVVAISLSLGMPWLIAAIVFAPLVLLVFTFSLGIVRRDELLILAGALDRNPPPETDMPGRPRDTTEVVP